MELLRTIKSEFTSSLFSDALHQLEMWNVSRNYNRYADIESFYEQPTDKNVHNIPSEK
jgi:hypothetical protein